MGEAAAAGAPALTSAALGTAVAQLRAAIAKIGDVPAAVMEARVLDIEKDGLEDAMAIHVRAVLASPGMMQATQSQSIKTILQSLKDDPEATAWVSRYLASQVFDAVIKPPT